MREVFDRAYERITQEQACLRSECAAFRRFREAASMPQATDRSGSDVPTDSILEAYRETVVASSEFDSLDGEPLVECLNGDFSPPIVNALLEDDSLSRRLKRKLLLETNGAIERREQLHDTLEIERESIRTSRDEVLDIEQTLEALSACSLRVTPFDELVEVWETCETLGARDDRLLQQRQSTIRKLDDEIGLRDYPHALNQYLYDDLETTYPALHGIARSRERVERFLRGDVRDLRQQRNPNERNSYPKHGG